MDSIYWGSQHAHTLSFNTPQSLLITSLHTQTQHILTLPRPSTWVFLGSHFLVTQNHSGFTLIQEFPTFKKVHEFEGETLVEADDEGGVLVMFSANCNITMYSKQEGLIMLAKLDGAILGNMGCYFFDKMLKLTFKGNEQFLVYEFEQGKGMMDHYTIPQLTPERQVAKVCFLKGNALLISKDLNNNHLISYKATTHHLIGQELLSAEVTGKPKQFLSILLRNAANCQLLHYHQLDEDCGLVVRNLQLAIQTGSQLRIMLKGHLRMRPVFVNLTGIVPWTSMQLSVESIAQLMLSDWLAGLSLLKDNKPGLVKDPALAEYLLKRLDEPRYNELARKSFMLFDRWESLLHKLFVHTVLSNDSRMTFSEMLKTRLESLKGCAQRTIQSQLRYKMNYDQYMTIVESVHPNYQDILFGECICAADKQGSLCFLVTYTVQTCFQDSQKLMLWMGFDHQMSKYEPIFSLENSLLQVLHGVDKEENLEVAKQQIRLILVNDLLYQEWIVPSLLRLVCLFGKSELTFPLLLSGQVNLRGLNPQLLVDVFLIFSMPMECYFILRQLGGDVPIYFWRKTMKNKGVRECFQIKMSAKEFSELSRIVNSEYPCYSRFLEDVRQY